MNIITHSTHHPKIEIVEIDGDLSENTALEIKRLLYAYMDKGKYYMIIDFRHVEVIDHQVINILGNFKDQDVTIRLFNVGPRVRWMIRGSARFDVLRKIYDHTDSVGAVSLFEKEVLQKRRTRKSRINKRRYPRSINITVPAEFNYSPSQNKMITGQLNILNISEEGALAGEIEVVNKLTGRTFRPLQINGQKLYSLTFRLMEDRPIIETTVKCVRDYNIDEKLYAGFVFLDLNDENKEDIRDFVGLHYDLGQL